MSKRRFSIVMPTRQRHETLHYAIQTILNQTFDDFELIICDNFSSPETRQVVEAFDDARIRYVRTETSLAMTDNWEFAVSHAQGEFITVVGDDDGLLKHGLAVADAVLRDLNIDVLHFKQLTYLWPSYLLPKQANQLTIPLNTVDRVMTAKKVFKQLFQVDYLTFHDLP